jgi:hypothetical protein
MKLHIRSNIICSGLNKIKIVIAKLFKNSTKVFLKHISQGSGLNPKCWFQTISNRLPKMAPCKVSDDVAEFKIFKS